MTRYNIVNCVKSLWSFRQLRQLTKRGISYPFSPGGSATSTPDTGATSTCSSAVTTDTTTSSAPSSPRSSPCAASGTCSSTRGDASPWPPPASERHQLAIGCYCSPMPSTRPPPTARKGTFPKHTFPTSDIITVPDRLKWLFMVPK